MKHLNLWKKNLYLDVLNEETDKPTSDESLGEIFFFLNIHLL